MPHSKHELGWPSVTEVLDSYNKSWLKFFYRKWGNYEKAEAYSAIRRESGTRIHAAFEALLQNKGVQAALELVNEDERKAVVGLDGWIRGAEVMSLVEEKHVECKEFQYHGTFDHKLVIQNPKGWIKPTDFFNNYVDITGPYECLSDLKTQDGREVNEGEIKKHMMQQALYAKAEEEATGEFINKGLIINVDIKTGEVDAIPVHPLRAYLEPALLQRQLYDLINSKGKWEHLRRRKAS